MPKAGRSSSSTRSNDQLPAKHPGGRPTNYNPELALAFRNGIAEGKSIRQMVAQPEWPSHTTIHRWLQENEEFRDQYRVARELQADMLADEVIPIADGELPTKGRDGELLRDNDQVKRDGHRLRARIWKAGRMSPRKWGDDLDQADLGAITPSVIIIRDSADVRIGVAHQANPRKGHDSE